MVKDKTAAGYGLGDQYLLLIVWIQAKLVRFVNQHHDHLHLRVWGLSQDKNKKITKNHSKAAGILFRYPADSR